MCRGCRGLDRTETDGVVSVLFQRLLHHLLQQRQFIAQSTKTGKSIDFFVFLHVSVKQHSVEVQLQRSSSEFLSN